MFQSKGVFILLSICDFCLLAVLELQIVDIYHLFEHTFLDAYIPFSVESVIILFYFLFCPYASILLITLVESFLPFVQ